MRLKGQKTQNAISNRSLDRSEDTRNGDILNGSSASCSSASAIGTQDDLDNAIDSADDEIDVGTNADSIEYNNGNSANTSAALSGINNDHQFGIFNNQSLNSYSSNLNSNQQSSQSGSITEADRKRAHHNALERKRRDHIKDSFHTLRDAIPNIKGEKTSRAQILKAATDYIRQMRTRNIDYQNDIEIIKKQNNDIENQIKQLEKARQTASHLLKQQQSNQNDPLDGNISDDLDEIKDYKFDITENKSSLAAIVASVTAATAAPTQTAPTQTAPTQTAPTQTAPTQTAPTKTATTTTKTTVTPAFMLSNGVRLKWQK